MDSYSLRLLRLRLKHNLHTDRAILTKAGLAPLCPVCEKPVYGSGDMHENIVTKRNVQGASIDTVAMIFVPENCVIVHTGECHQLAQGPAREKVTKFLIAHEGRDKILQWLEKINESVNTTFTL